MINGWWIAAGLFIIIIIIIQVILYRRLKNQLQQATTESARLQRKLSFIQNELAEVQTRRKRLLAASTQALIIVEKNHQVSSANKVAKRLFGKLNETMTFTEWTRQHQLTELVDQTLAGEKMPPVYFSRADKVLEVHARSIKLKKQVAAVALAIHDVTELQRLSRARRDFVTNISHELRTPLASISLLTETLLDGALDDSDMALSLIHKIAAQIDTLNQLARELMDLSLIESGQAPLRLSTYSLSATVQAQIEHLRFQAERKNLALKIDIAEDIKVLVDETMMGRVITNLIHNAIKFTETGSITISAERINGTALGQEKDEGDWIKVSIADTGVGIPPDELNRIFERFYKIDRARSRKQAGTGLGLAIAKHIVEAHGGRIWANNNSRAGATFHFTLPVEE